MGCDCDLLASCHRGGELVVDILNDARGLSKCAGKVRKDDSEGSESTEKENALEPIQSKDTTENYLLRRFKAIICSCQPF